MNPILEIKQVSKAYKDKKSGQQIQALKEVSFSVFEEETLGIIGESGCGKSTLLRLIVLLEPMSQGHIFYRGIETKQLFKENKKKFRREIQIIFQNPYSVFDPRQTIQNILMQTLKIHRIEKNKKKSLDILKESLTEVGFDDVDKILQRHPHELSGGQLQRISILRSLLLNPKLIVADEPVSMLDVSIRADVLQILSKAQQDNRSTMVIVSHDILTLSNTTQRLIVMLKGQIVEIIDSSSIFDSAIHPYTQLLMANSLGKKVSMDSIEASKEIFLSFISPYPQAQLVEISSGHFVNTDQNLL